MKPLPQNCASSTCSIIVLIMHNYYISLLACQISCQRSTVHLFYRDGHALQRSKQCMHVHTLSIINFVLPECLGYRQCLSIQGQTVKNPPTSLSCRCKAWVHRGGITQDLKFLSSSSLTFSPITLANVLLTSLFIKSKILRARFVLV